MKNSKFKIQNSKLRNFKIFNLQFSIGNSRRAGFTLIELMIAVTITVLALSAVYTSFIVQQRSFVTQDQVSETQVSSKIAFDILVDRIRGAGFGYPITETPPINGISDIISTTGDAGNGNSPDLITVVGGFRALGSIGLPAGQGTAQIEQRDATGYYLDICYSTATRFNITNMRYLSIDGIFYDEVTLINNTGGSADCDFDGTNETVSRLYLDRPLTIEFPVNRPIYLIENVVLQLNGTDLQIITPSGTDTLVSNIDDLQFAYAIDANNDGEIDDPNGNNTFDPGDYVNPPFVGSPKVLAVRANLLASTANPDPTLDPSTKPYSAGITLENGSTIGAGDRIRRRVWSTEILLKNPR